MKVVKMLISVALPGQLPETCGRFASQLDQAGVDMIVLDGKAHSLDPLILASWLAPRVKQAGLVATVPALYAAPFHTARALSAIDFMLSGRCAWQPTTLGHAEQAVTVGTNALTPDADVLPKGMDFIAATNALWDSWDADALIIDQESGVYLDADRVRRVHYKGPYFQVMGPLNAARPPQGYPVLVQSDADALWETAAKLTDVLLVTTPTSDVLAARKAQIARVGGQARLLAQVTVDTTSSVIELAIQIAAWAETGADGVHIVPAAPGAMDRVLDLISTLDKSAGEGAKATSLHARLGLDAPAATLIKKAHA